MSLEHKITNEIELRFSEETKVYDNRSGATLFIDAYFELKGNKYKSGDYILFDYVYACGLGNMFIRRVVGKLEGINYLPNSKKFVLEFSGVYCSESDTSECDTGAYMRYKKMDKHLFKPVDLLGPSNLLKKITKEGYEKIISG